jgi:hypothetical protein
MLGNVVSISDKRSFSLAGLFKRRRIVNVAVVEVVSLPAILNSK